MKKIFTLLLISVASVSYGQINPSSFDSTARDLTYLKENCLSISDDELPENPKQNCSVRSVDSLFTSDKKTWYLAQYWYSGVFGDLENSESLSDELKKRQYDYQAIVLFEKQSDSEMMSANFVVSNDPFSAQQIRDPEFNISSEGPLLKLTFFQIGDFERYEYYLFSEKNWVTIENESWKERIDEFLPEDYYFHPIMPISVYDLSSSSNVFDREWLGSGDQMRDVKKFGEINLKLAIEDQKFVIDSFCFVRNTEW